jgi:hypothetical protein
MFWKVNWGVWNLMLIFAVPMCSTTLHAPEMGGADGIPTRA